MSALAINIGLSSDNNSVTKISAHARIDYILRFSKQAILVIDESVEQSAPFSGQFLADLPEQHNAAYISLSAQFNNIQIRCRIIEQLYTGELFDPEISLAVSVINLAKKSQQAISIVLDNAQHLSLQVLHELSQLAAIAKKANLIVNIVLFGSPQAGKIVADNKSLFENKLTLLSAQSGQLLSTASIIFKDTRPKWQFIIKSKWLIIALATLFGLASLVIALLQQDSFNFAKFIALTNQEEISLTKELAKPQVMVLGDNSEVQTVVDASALKLAPELVVENRAIASDIYSSLTNPIIEQVKMLKVLPATPADIISAIVSDSAPIESSVHDTPPVEHHKQRGQDTLASDQLSKKLVIDNGYYANKTGYVIQISAFSDFNLPKIFLDTLTSIDYKIYQRLLNEQPLMVVTSRIYAQRAAAESALAQLPELLLARRPWIKSVAVINNEINAFLHSQ